MDINLGILLELRAGSATRYRFQNYKVASDVNYEGQTYLFAPFSFSGAVSNLSGDNLDAAIVFPSTRIVRTWASEALVNQWVGKVSVLLLEDDSQVARIMYSYVGVIAQGGWSSESVELSLNTIVDAVRGEIPGRRMNGQLVGNIPITANIRV